MTAASGNAIPPFWILIFFPLAWFAVAFLLGHISGWADLGTRHRTREPPPSEHVRRVSGKMGLISYNRALTVGWSAPGLHLSAPFLFRLSHPPLLIPWEEIVERQDKKALWMAFVRLRIRGGPTLVLPTKIVDRFASRLPAPERRAG
jgi:hypothetical protein